MATPELSAEIIDVTSRHGDGQANKRNDQIASKYPWWSKPTIANVFFFLFLDK